MIILIFGQPASGKTTLAKALMNTPEMWIHDLIWVDGEKWRELNDNKDYSKEGRILNLKSAFTMAKFLDGEGFTPVLSFVTPYEEARQYLRSNGLNLVQIWLECNTDRGRNSYFATDFEEPTGKYLKINTSSFTIEESLSKAKEFINKHKN